MKSGSVFSTWWNGGLRTTPYYHNMIGLLTEIIGSPNPSTVPLVPQRLIPNGGTPNPVTPQTWLFKNSIDYSVSLNYAVLNYAARHKDELLLNIYKMGKNSIEAGSKDHWTLSPKKVEMLNALIKADKKESRTDTLPVAYFNKIYQNQDLKDPRGYIIPSSQTTTAVDFVNILIQSGIKVEKASSTFTVAGKTYPAGSYVVKTNQAFRPHLLDMFEPQDHPNDFLYPGGPPVRPYDAAGWTPAFTMGISFDRIMDDFEGPFQAIPYGEVQKATGKINTPVANAVGYTFSTRDNASFVAINDLLKAKAQISKNKDHFFVAADKRLQPILEQISTAQGAVFTAVSVKPQGMQPIQPMRIALWDRYGGSMPSGWLRWIFEQYHFPAQVIYAKEIDAGKLNDKYDVIVFVEGAIPSLRTEEANPYADREPKAEDIPAMYQHTLGRITQQKSIPAIQKFIENGGRVVAIGSSANLAYHLNLPVKNALVEMVNGQTRTLPGEKYYVPGSILQVALDDQHQANWGMSPNADVYFSNSPVFKLSAQAVAQKQISPLAWFATDKPLRSGWAYGQSYLQDGVAAFEAKIGKGSLFVYGPEITFRAQTHGTYKMLFNQLYQ